MASGKVLCCRSSMRLMRLMELQKCCFAGLQRWGSIACGLAPSSSSLLAALLLHQEGDGTHFPRARGSWQPDPPPTAPASTHGCCRCGGCSQRWPGLSMLEQSRRCCWALETPTNLCAWLRDEAFNGDSFPWSWEGWFPKALHEGVNHRHGDLAPLLHLVQDLGEKKVTCETPAGDGVAAWATTVPDGATTSLPWRRAQSSPGSWWCRRPQGGGHHGQMAGRGWEKALSISQPRCTSSTPSSEILPGPTRSPTPRCQITHWIFRAEAQAQLML